MTAVAASRHRVPRERPSLRAKMCEGYLLAAVFALESWADSARVADSRKGGLTVAQGVAILRREFWQDEADRCEAIVKALEAMAP